MPNTRNQQKGKLRRKKIRAREVMRLVDEKKVKELNFLFLDLTMSNKVTRLSSSRKSKLAGFVSVSLDLLTNKTFIYFRAKLC